MKKIISITLCIMLVVAALTALALPSSAVNAQVLRAYENANDGDILFLADFNDPAYLPNSSAAKCGQYTPSEDGLELHIKGVQGKDQNLNFFGACFSDLSVPLGAKVTFVCQVKTNGSAGKNNSIGIGGWFIDGKGGPTTWSFYNEYGNWNSEHPEQNRSALSYNNSKLQDYSTNIDAATVDADGYIMMKIEFDSSAKMMTSYYVKDGKWEMNNLYGMSKANDHGVDDCLGVAIYNFYEVVDTTIKNVKFFKGVDLSVEDVAKVENVTPPVTTTEQTTPDPTNVIHDCTTTSPTTAEPEPVATPEPTTEAPTVATTTALTTPEATQADDGGCGSSLSLAAITLIPVGLAVILPKRRDD